MLSHGVIFNDCSAKVRSPAINETYLSYDKDIWIVVTEYFMYFYLIMFSSIGSYTSVHKFYSFTMSIFLINSVIAFILSRLKVKDCFVRSVGYGHFWCYFHIFNIVTQNSK